MLYYLVLIENFFVWWPHDSSLIMALMVSPGPNGIHDCIYLIMLFISCYLFTNYYTVYFMPEFIILSKPVHHIQYNTSRTTYLTHAYSVVIPINIFIVTLDYQLDTNNTNQALLY